MYGSYPTSTASIAAKCGAAPPLTNAGLPRDISAAAAYDTCARQVMLEEGCKTRPTLGKSALVLGGTGLVGGAGAGALLGLLFGNAGKGAIIGGLLGAAFLGLPYGYARSVLNKECAAAGYGGWGR